MKSCVYLNTTLVFSSSDITPCYTCNSTNVPFYPTKENQNFRKIRQSFIEELNTDSEQKYACKECCHLADIKENEKGFFHIVIKLWDAKKFEYNFYEIIQNLYDNNCLDIENLSIEVQSGDVSSITFLEDIVNIFEKNGYKEIRFLTNNISYHPVIEKILAKGKGQLSTIPDYKRNNIYVSFEYIKKTLRSYLGSASDKNAVTVYYTMVKNHNDNEKDIQQFIKTMYTLGVNKLAFRLDNKDINKWISHKGRLSLYPKHYAKLIILFFKLANKYNFYLDMTYEEQNIVLRKIFKANKINKFKIKIKLKRKIKNFIMRLINKIKKSRENL